MAMKLVMASLAAADVFTDINFIVVSYSCGSWLWKWSLGCFILAVGGCQIGVGLCQTWVSSLQYRQLRGPVLYEGGQ